MEILIYAALAAIPAYYIWNDLAPIYLAQIPNIYQHIPFWNMVEIFIFLALVRFVIFPTPVIMNKNIWRGRRG